MFVSVKRNVGSGRGRKKIEKVRQACSARRPAKGPDRGESWEDLAARRFVLRATNMRLVTLACQHEKPQHLVATF